MAPTDNPYAPPEAPVADSPVDDPAWHHEGFLVLRRKGSVAACCVHCASEKDLANRRFALLWRHPVGCGVTLFGIAAFCTVPFLFGQVRFGDNTAFFAWLAIPVVVIVANLVFRSARFTMRHAVCMTCRLRYRRWFATSAALGVGALALGIAVFDQAPEVALVSWLVALAVWLLARVVRPRSLKAAWVDGDLVWLRGPDAAVRSRYPSLPSHLAERGPPVTRRSG